MSTVFSLVFKNANKVIEILNVLPTLDLQKNKKLEELIVNKTTEINNDRNIDRDSYCGYQSLVNNTNNMSGDFHHNFSAIDDRLNYMKNFFNNLNHEPKIGHNHSYVFGESDPNLFHCWVEEEILLQLKVRHQHLELTQSEDTSDELNEIIGNNTSESNRPARQKFDS